MKKRRSSSRGSAANAPAAAPRAPTYDDILAIARLIESGSRFSEFRLRSGDIEVEVRRANGADPASTLSPALSQGRGSDREVASQGREGIVAPAKAGAQLPMDLPSGTKVVKSPMVGTFFSAPEPSAAPFVEPGSHVAADTIVCIIEVMKLMNSVTAGVSGVVTHVFVENAQMVEYGQALIAIRPEP